MPGSPSFLPLPALDVPVQVLREQFRLQVGSGEIYAGPRTPGDERPRVVQWKVEGGLMPDEMILIFGRPLDWTGPVCEQDPSLPLIEGCLGGPLILTRRSPVVRSPEPDFADRIGHHRVGWCFGAVLLRGDDNPWYAQSLITIRRIPGPAR